MGYYYDSGKRPPGNLFVLELANNPCVGMQADNDSLLQLVYQRVL